MTTKKPVNKPKTIEELSFEDRRDLFTRDVNDLIKKYKVNLRVRQDIVTIDDLSREKN